MQLLLIKLFTSPEFSMKTRLKIKTGVRWLFYLLFLIHKSDLSHRPSYLDRCHYSPREKRNHFHSKEKITPLAW